MRIFLFLVLASLNFAFAASTQEKIKSSKNSLRSAEAMSQQLNKKLDDLAGDIVGGEQKLKAIGVDIANLKQQISLLESNATSATGELEKLNAQNKELIQAQKELEQNETTQSEDSIIVSHILNKLNGVMKEDFKRLSKNYEDTITQINSQSNKINQINSSLKNYKRKQSDLLALENKQKSTINDLKRDKGIYTKKLAKLQSQQEELQKTLEQLAIVQKREDDEAAERARRQKEQRQAAAKGQKTPAADGSAPMSSSYQTSSVKRYTGAKTIAPLDSFTVKQKFGNYVDPIYNLKIFNESVVLRSNTPDAKVKSVLNGKVVFAKQTALLDRVVIIENDNGIHTIYAHLSQIAPTIKIGSVVQKGYVIGRVKDDLTFEVTQKNYHIDPLELISLK